MAHLAFEREQYGERQHFIEFQLGVSFTKPQPFLDWISTIKGSLFFLFLNSKTNLYGSQEAEPLFFKLNTAADSWEAPLVLPFPPAESYLWSIWDFSGDLCPSVHSICLQLSPFLVGGLYSIVELKLVFLRCKLRKLLSWWVCVRIRRAFSSHSFNQSFRCIST